MRQVCILTVDSVHSIRVLSMHMLGTACSVGNSETVWVLVVNLRVT